MVDTHKYTLKKRLVSLQFILHVYIKVVALKLAD